MKALTAMMNEPRGRCRVREMGSSKVKGLCETDGAIRCFGG